MAEIILSTSSEVITGYLVETQNGRLHISQVALRILNTSPSRPFIRQ